MRLLQLATGAQKLIDLHPNVTVVAGLDDEGRSRLIAAVRALSTGEAAGLTGLLEAHGVLFDLGTEMLSLLDIATDGVRPVVTRADLPAARNDPQARERLAAERAMAEVHARWVRATEEHALAGAAIGADGEALERAHRALAEADADPSGRIDSVDELTAHVDQAIERRRRLEEQLAEAVLRAAEAAAERARVEAATADERERQQATAVRCTELAARLDQARLALDPSAEADAELAASRLAEAEAEVAGEREAEAQARAAAGDDDDEAPVERLERIEQAIEDLEKRLAAYGPAEVHEVANALEAVRAHDGGVLVPMPEASELADQIAALEVQLVASSGPGSTAGTLPEARVRLDDARQALIDAEQAARTPELDRAMVDKLEQAHADLLDAQDKADRRFGGARAERRVDELRRAEHAVLDEMGFTSYSDYMMGYSLLHVDPEKEAALEAARTELSSAEDAWRLLEAETDAELARAALMERRRGLIKEARALLGRSTPPRAIVDELRALRVEAQPSPSILNGLRDALDDAGLALGDEVMDRDDLVLVAEAWLVEAADAATREQELRGSLLALVDDRTDARVAVEATAALAAEPAGLTAEERRVARLEAAELEVQSAAARRRAHAAAQAELDSLAAELAEAAEAERVAAEASREANEAVAAAVAEDDAAQEERRRIEAALDDAMQAEALGQDDLRAHDEPERALTPEALTRAVTVAESAALAHRDRAADAARRVAELEVERSLAATTLEALRGEHGAADESSLAEEIEWYLLARLAAQRSVSLGGSLPLLLDDALDGLDEDVLAHVLGRLERMAEAVQVILISDDPLAAGWALLVGADRAAVVHPQSA